MPNEEIRAWISVILALSLSMGLRSTFNQLGYQRCNVEDRGSGCHAMSPALPK